MHDTYDTADEMEIIDYNIQPPEDDVGDLPDLNDQDFYEILLFTQLRNNKKICLSEYVEHGQIALCLFRCLVRGIPRELRGVT